MLNAKLAQHEPHAVGQTAEHATVVISPVRPIQLAVHQLQPKHRARDASDQQRLGKAGIAADMRDQLGLDATEEFTLSATSINAVAKHAPFKGPAIWPNGTAVAG